MTREAMGSSAFGLTLIYLGLTTALDTAWGLVLLVPLLVVMHLGVVRREERYLDGKFGDVYRRYRAGVRRYLSVGGSPGLLPEAARRRPRA